MKALFQTLIDRIFSVNLQIQFYPFLREKGQQERKKEGREGGKKTGRLETYDSFSFSLKE